MLKLSKTARYIFFFLILILIVHIVLEKYYFKDQMEVGVTFSPRHAEYLNLDFKKTYTEILDELKVKNLRIPTYWEALEPQPKKYDFFQTDFMLDEAAKRGAKVVLVVGERQPRWPECHMPGWAKELSIVQRRQQLLGYIQIVVQRYKDHPALDSWQVENEPFLYYFGEDCDKPDVDFLKKEIALVRSMSNKKIIMSDSGELGGWSGVMQLSDIFGTTLYRQVYDSRLGYVTYPLPPYFYNLKSLFIRNLFARSNQKTIIVELQTEPWLAGGKFVSAEEQSRLFSPKDFESYINFAKKTGFDEAYLWGVEWWYFMAENGYPEYLNFAKTLF